MAEPNPFELQPQPPPPQWGGMPQITPQTGEVPPPGQFGGLPPDAGGSYFQLSPEAMQMMWAPQTQPQSLAPQPQLPPQINPYA
jgi:hypothetical protein